MAPKQANKTPAPVAAATPAAEPATATKATKKAPSTKAATPAVVAPVETTPAPAVVAPAVATKATKKAPSTKAATPVETPVAEPVSQPATDAPAEDAPATGERRKPSKESINSDFERLNKLLNEKLALLAPAKEGASTDGSATDAKKKRKRAPKGLGIKDVRLIKRTLEQMQKDHVKVSKIKNSNRKNNTSGLKLPVKLSDEMYDFCGWEKGSLHSRVEVNKKLNAYVKDHKLQNPEDGRQIFPDTKLKAILRIEPADNTPIAFYMLTAKSSVHFPESVSKKKKAAKAAAAAAATA